MSAGEDGDAVLATLARIRELAGTEEFVSFADPWDNFAVSSLTFEDGTPDAGDEERERLREASEFAVRVNEVPSFGLRWSRTDRLVWNEYRRMFYAEWASEPGLSEAERAELEDARAKVLETDQTLESFHEEAVAELRDRGDREPEDLQEAAMERATERWEEEGHADVHAGAVETIHRLTASEATDLRREAKEKLDRMRRFDLDRKQFYWTSYGGARHLDDDAKWPSFELDADDLAEYAGKVESEHPELLGSAWSALSTWSVADVERVSFEARTVDVRRPWLDTTALTSGCWRLGDDEREPFSDGDQPPDGRLPGYVTRLILGRNLEIVPRPAARTGSLLQLREGTARSFGPFPLEQPPSTEPLEDLTTVESLSSFRRRALFDHWPAGGDGADDDSGTDDSGAGGDAPVDTTVTGRIPTTPVEFPLTGVDDRSDDGGQGGQSDDGGQGGQSDDQNHGDGQGGDATFVANAAFEARFQPERIRSFQPIEQPPIVDVPEVPVLLQSGCQGRVTRPPSQHGDEEPLEGAELTFRHDSRDVTRTVTTGEDGTYRTSLPEGPYTAIVTKNGYEVHHEAVTVDEEEYTTLDVTLEPKPGAYEPEAVVDGIVILGYACHPLPAVPDPREDLEWP